MFYRYLGNDELATKEKPGTEEILKRIKQEAEARKRKRTSDTLGDIPDNKDNDTSEKDGTENDRISSKKRKKLSIASNVLDEPTQDEIIDDEREDVIQHSKHKKKKKFPQTEQDQINGDSPNLSAENNTSINEERQTPKKHKKKKKHKEKESEIVTDTSFSDLNCSSFDGKLLVHSKEDDLDSSNEETDEALPPGEPREEVPVRGEGGHLEIGGFTVIGKVKPTKVTKVYSRFV